KSALRQLKHVALRILSVAERSGEGRVGFDPAHGNALSDELGAKLLEGTLDRHHQLGIALDLPRARIGGTVRLPDAVKRQLARARLQHRPLSFDLFDDGKLERIAVEIPEPPDILNVENDAREGEVHGTSLRNGPLTPAIACGSTNGTPAGGAWPTEAGRTSRPTS